MDKPRTRKILLTGFGPFPNVSANLSGPLIHAVADKLRAEYRDILVSAHVLPTIWGEGPDRIASLMHAHRPDICLHFGVSESAMGFQIETTATNACHFKPDAAGLYPAGLSLRAEGERFLAATLPVADIVARLASLSLPVAASDDAGGYLCNAVLYRALETATSITPRPRVGFIHVPHSATADTLPMADLIHGAAEIAHICLLDEQD